MYESLHRCEQLRMRKLRKSLDEYIWFDEIRCLCLSLCLHMFNSWKCNYISIRRRPNDWLCWNVLCASEINLPLKYSRFGHGRRINHFSFACPPHLWIVFNHNALVSLRAKIPDTATAPAPLNKGVAAYYETAACGMRKFSLKLCKAQCCGICQGCPVLLCIMVNTKLLSCFPMP